MLNYKKLILGVVLVAIFLVGSVFYIYLSSQFDEKDLKRISEFLNTLRFKQDLGGTYLLNYTPNLSYPCIFKVLGKYTTQSNSLLGDERINYAIFNRSLPLIDYLRIDIVAKNSLEAYTNEFQQNHYACLPDLPNIFSNSRSTSFQYKGIYVFCFSNFTDEGLTNAGVLYIGEKPDLYWCFANTMYKNTRISYGEWGFVESQNLTTFLNSANATIEEFISSYSR
jgi:hypothetical protein